MGINRTVRNAPWVVMNHIEIESGCRLQNFLFQIVTKKIFHTIKEETQAINELLVKIRSGSVEYAEKVNDLQKHDKQLSECLQQQLTNVEKLVGGKMNKQHFLDADTTLHKKKEACLEKIKSLLNAI